MRKLPAVILFVLTALSLVTSVTGCRGAQRYDNRLVAADSLMRRFPDSALAVVEGCDGLTAEADLAYRALLLTQARYKSYIQSTSDSAINCALAYYRAHPKEREKLTRAYIYKGAVMEELDNPDSAMLYYKHAEATAAPDDYFNLGYAKLRIAELYQRQYYQDSAAITRLWHARDLFEMIRDTNYLIVAYEILGSIYGIKYPDSSEYYLNKAVGFSQQYKPSLQYTYKSKLSTLYLYKGNNRLANQYAMDVLLNGKSDSYESSFYFNAALSYVRMGLLDSAKQIIRVIPKPVDIIDSLNYYNLMAELAKAENDDGKYGLFTSLAGDLSSRILLQSDNSVLAKSELRFDIEHLEKKGVTMRSLNKLFRAIIALAVIVILSLLFCFRKRVKAFQVEKLEISRELESTMARLNELLIEKKGVSELLGLRMSALNELYQDIRVKTEGAGRVKKIIPLSSLFQILNERSQILNIQLTDSFWKKMRDSVNGEYNGILDFIENHYPNLTRQDIDLFCLSCANLSPQIIKLCLNYSNAKTVSNYRIKLLKQKMGYDMSFDEFIRLYMDGKL